MVVGGGFWLGPAHPASAKPREESKAILRIDISTSSLSGETHMSLEISEGEKCYQFLDGGVHCWDGPIAAFRDRQHSAKSDWS